MSDPADEIARDLYRRCLEIAEDERRAFLASVCSDTTVLTEVQRLLEAAHGEAREPSSGASERLLEQLAAHRPSSSRYRFEEEIDRGGMGAVLRVHDEDLNRPLAMKVVLGAVPTEPSGETPPLDPAKVGRFLEEAQVTGQLDHPGVVPVHELSVDEDGRAYFTMRLVRGDDLRKVFARVQRGDPEWSTTRVAGVLLKVAETMAYAHQKGVIHRDLKPANVMVGRFGEVYVMDWGLARVLGEPDPHDLRIRGEAEPSHVHTLRHEDSDTPGSPLITMDGTIIGTPSYMSPEQARTKHEEVGPPSDVYALGAILYSLLTGRSPYIGPDEQPSPYAIWRWVLDGPPRPVRELAPSAPPELVAICERAMQRDVDRRYPSMAALADDLRAYLEGRVVTAYEQGAWAELRKWTRRNRGMARALAALVVVLVSSGFLLAWQERRRTLAAEAREATLIETADLDRLERLDHDAALLWPVDGRSRARTEAWLGAAEELFGRADRYERRRAALAAGAVPASFDDPLEQRRFERRAEHLAYLEQRQRIWTGRTEDGTQSAHDLAVLAAELPLLERRIARERWSLELDRPTQLVNARDPGSYRRVVRIGALLERLGHPEFGRFATVRDRDARLRRELASALDDPLWEDVRAEVELGPIPLVRPLGRDTISGLWEFLHVPSGAAPGGRRGAWEIDADTGLVLVLIPGGPATVGVQNTDPQAANFAVPENLYPSGLLEVELAPYLLSKYEMTCAQWERMTGTLPNEWYPGADLRDGRVEYDRVDRCHPVESISHEDCQQLAVWGLALPTEAQWERAARAESEWTDPGRACHDRVDGGEPNALGLHRMLGNVWEWVAEPHVNRFEATRFDGVEPGTGALRSLGQTRTARGGAFDSIPQARHPAYRWELRPTWHDRSVGVRPCITIPSETAPRAENGESRLPDEERSE